MDEDVEMYVEQLFCQLQESVKTIMRFTRMEGTEARERALAAVTWSDDILGEVRRVLETSDHQLRTPT